MCVKTVLLQKQRISTPVYLQKSVKSDVFCVNKPDLP